MVHLCVRILMRGSQSFDSTEQDVLTIILIEDRGRDVGGLK